MREGARQSSEGVFVWDGCECERIQQEDRESLPVRDITGEESRSRRSFTHLKCPYWSCCFVGCASISIGGSSSIPSLFPQMHHTHIPLPPLPTLPVSVLPHIVASLNADNCWQMDCVAHCMSVGSEERGKGEQRGRVQKCAWHRWLIINTDLASDWTWQLRSRGVWDFSKHRPRRVWKVVECD